MTKIAAGCGSYFLFSDFVPTDEKAENNKNVFCAFEKPATNGGRKHWQPVIALLRHCNSDVISR